MNFKIGYICIENYIKSIFCKILRMIGILKVLNIVVLVVNIGFFWLYVLCNEVRYSRYVCVVLWSYVW